MATVARSYMIQHDPDAVFQAGETATGELVIAGCAPNGSVVAVKFQKNGTFFRAERVTGPAASPAACRALAQWQSEAGFSPATVNIGPFWAEELAIGVRELPQFMYEMLEAAPDEGDAGFTPELYEDIKEFIQGGQFVLVWCGKEFWMSRGGEITDT